MNQSSLGAGVIVALLVKLRLPGLLVIQVKVYAAGKVTDQ